MLEIRRLRPLKREVSVVPMVNIVFLLLVFFLVAGTIEKIEVIPVDPPMAESGKVLDEGHVVILLGRHDEIIIGDELVEMDDIIPIITKELKESPSKIITLKADSGIAAKRLIEVMDHVKAAGGRNMSLVTQSPFQSAPGK